MGGAWAIGVDARPRTLADTIPGDVVRDAGLIVGFALLTAVAARITIPLGSTPVPITGQTFAVLLSGAALGSVRGLAAQFLYVALGAVGLPVYAANADGVRGGWGLTTGSTAGYLIGFVMAAALVGWLAERGHDRRIATAVPAFVAGTVVIYLFGVVWLSQSMGVPLLAGSGERSAISLGVTPFVFGDALKVALAGLVLPAAWYLRTLGEE